MPDLTLNPDFDDQKLLAMVIDYHHRTLKANTNALDYLQSRGVTSSQAIDKFSIGFADRTLGLMMPSRTTNVGMGMCRRLQALGIVRRSGHAHFVGCVIFPITAADGSRRVVDIYGRKLLGKKLKPRCQLELHLNDERRGVWNVEALGAAKEIILCPSLWDALSFWCNGFRNVTVMFGTDALTDDHLAAFKEFKTQRVLTPCAQVAPKLMTAGIDVFLLQLPPTLSVNDLAKQSDDPADVLGTLLRKAEWLGKGEAPVPMSVPVLLPAEPIHAAVEQEQLERAAAVEQQHDEVVKQEEADDDQQQDLQDDEEIDTDEQPHHEPDNQGDDQDDADEQPAPDPQPDVPLRTDSPLPPMPQDIEAEVHEDEVVMTLGSRRYRVRGWTKNLSFDVLKVNVLASNDVGMFVDTFDLYSAKYRRSFVVQAAQELRVEETTIKHDLGRVLLKLEQLQDQRIDKTLEIRTPEPTMTEGEKTSALRFLRDPELLDRIVADFDIIGERNNKLVGYLAAVSRKLDQPLAIVVQSTSAAGKTALMEAVLAFIPPEDVVKYSALTGQALYYLGEASLRHKLLAIVEEEGATKASYALKLLQSEGELRIASTGKDDTGRLVTQEYRVRGPVMIFLTTTSVHIDEELLNRCIVLSVDEDREQTRAIHQEQRKRQTLAGLLSSQDREEKLTLHRNAQRLLRPILVANPFAEQLTFLDDRTRTRRDHVKYLTLIRAIALLHQHQRPVRTIEHQGKAVEYIEVTADDIDIANRLASDVLGRSLDELPPQTRRLLNLIDQMVTRACQQLGVDRADYRFSRREVREYTGWGHTQLATHLQRLEAMEYLIVHRRVGRGRLVVYELAYQTPTAGSGFLTQLLDVTRLRRNGHAAHPG